MLPMASFHNPKSVGRNSAASHAQAYVRMLSTSAGLLCCEALSSSGMDPTQDFRMNILNKAILVIAAQTPREGSVA